MSILAPEKKEKVESSTEKSKNLVLINDEHNSFDFVINCLIRHCAHSSQQAEQCALITHYKGKCDVKRGSFEDLETPYYALLSEGLTVEIQ